MTWQSIATMPVGRVVEAQTCGGPVLPAYRTERHEVVSSLNGDRVHPSVYMDRWVGSRAVWRWREPTKGMPLPPRARPGNKTRHGGCITLKDAYWDPLPGAPDWGDCAGKWI